MGNTKEERTNTSSSFLLHIFSRAYPKSVICCGHKEVVYMETATLGSVPIAVAAHVYGKDAQ